MGLHYGKENPPPIDTWNRSEVYTVMLSYWHRFDVRSQATAIDAHDGLAASHWLVPTPFLTHPFSPYLRDPWS